MDIEYLRMFVCLANNLSYTKAAKQLYMSPSTLSARVADLEREIGVPLVERTTRSVALTEAGQYFLEESRNLLQRFSELEFKTRSIAKGNVGSLKVGYLDWIGSDVVENTIVNYSRKFPNVNLQIRKCAYPQLIKSIGEMDLDVAYIMNNDLADTAPVISETLLSARLNVLVCDRHPLADRKMLKLSEIENEPVIAVENTQSKFLLDTISHIFARQGFVLNVVRECAGPEELALYVSSGQGIAFVSSFFSSMLVRFPRLRMIPLSHIVETREMCIIHHSSNPNTCIESFLEVARESADRMAAENTSYVRYVTKPE